MFIPDTQDFSKHLYPKFKITQMLLFFYFDWTLIIGPFDEFPSAPDLVHGAFSTESLACIFAVLPKFGKYLN